MTEKRNVTNSIDLYIPNKTNGIVVFYIHGGAWHIGTRDNSETACKSLSERGYICAATSYSLTNATQQDIYTVMIVIGGLLMFLSVFSNNKEQLLFMSIVDILFLFLLMSIIIFQPNTIVRHPKHVLDVTKQLKWVHENVANYGGDPNKIIICGHSAGAHIGALLCTNQYFLNELQIPMQCIRGFIGLSGVYSDKRLFEMPGGKKLLYAVFGIRENYYDAFPIYHVSNSTVPHLLLNAGWDGNLKRHTLDYHMTLLQKLVYVETVYYDELTHFNIYKNWTTTNSQVLDKINQFIQDVC
jgi:acetyl esterase/lipase